METKVNDFSGMNIYAGIDVHKKSWSVTLLADEHEHKTFNQPPGADALYKYLNKHFPGAQYYSAYEAGFSGYGHHRRMLELGIKNIVVNAADVPTSGKEKAGKTDKVDSRKIAKGLRNGDLQGIYVFEEPQQDLRSFARMRHIMQRDLRRAKQRIKVYLNFNTVSIPAHLDADNWSKAFEGWLAHQAAFPTANARKAFDFLLANYHYQKQQVRQISKQLRAYFRKQHKQDYYLLRTIPGIGPLSAIAIISELGDINRFANINKLSSYVGLLPLTSNSGETERVAGMSYRCNNYLRTILVEASWQAIRKDPAMLLYYKKHAAKGNGKRAIIKVTAKLLNRIRYVLKNKQEYVLGVVE
jgi:transposase